MTRRDLAVQNGKVVRFISEVTAPRNRGAKHVVISNPVDAMTMVCKKYSRAKFVISTGTNLESLRFRSRVAETLQIPVSKVEGWVGGEHGDAAIPLWSTTKVNNIQVDKYAATHHKKLSKPELTSYVKSVSKLIVDSIGGTEFGPAVSFRDITSAIVKNSQEILSIGAPFPIKDLPQQIIVGMPTSLGSVIGKQFHDALTAEEKKGIEEAARTIYRTYAETIEHLH